MILSDVSVRRPVFAMVLSLLLTIIGLMAAGRLSVRETPNVQPPIVSIETVYRGASASVVETKITQVIENQVAGLEGVDTLRSSSQDERSRITIEFGLDRDIESAANDVRDRVSRVLNNLPEEAEPPEVAKVDTTVRSDHVAEPGERPPLAAGAHRLRAALPRRPLLGRQGRRADPHQRRASLRDARLARPPGARGAQAHGHRRRGRAAR